MTVRNSHLGEDLVLTVRAADGQYHLDTGANHDDPWPASTDGLTTGEVGWIAVITGVEWGPVSLHMQLCQEPPTAFG